MMNNPTYSINLKKCTDKSAGAYSGELISDVIDKRLSNHGKIKAEFDLLYQGNGRGVFSLDSFLIESIREFIIDQERIIDSIEQELFNSYSKQSQTDLCITFDDLKKPEDIWKHPEFKLCQFRTRNHPADKQKVHDLVERFPGLADTDFSGDDPKALSIIHVLFSCEWEEEHDIDVEFFDNNCKGYFYV